MVARMTMFLRRTVVAVGVTAAVVTGSLAMPAPHAYAGLPGEEICLGENALVPVPCPPAVDLDRDLNVTTIRISVAPRESINLTITMETAEGQGRFEHTNTLTNPTDNVQRMTWTVPDYALAMGYRIVRAEVHAHEG